SGCPVSPVAGAGRHAGTGSTQWPPGRHGAKFPMTDADRVKLLFGRYRSPRFRLGRVVTDEARNRDVVIVGISDGRIPWPVGQPKGSRARSLIVFDALADAVRRESNQAVCHWRGITPQT